MKFLLALTFSLIAACGTSAAADLAILRNGNSIRHERKEIVGTITRLYLGPVNEGYIEIPSDQIDHFERDTTPVPAPTAARSTPPVGNAVTPQRQEAMTTEGLNQTLNVAGQRNQIDPDFIRSVIKAESGFHQNAVSRKGALGLMQLMPGTASELGVRNPFDPNANVEGGTKYLRDLLVKYNFDVNKALAAYNAGPKRVDQYHGIPPYYETQAYVARIIRDFNRQKIAKNPALAKKASAGPTIKSTHKTQTSRSRTTPAKPASSQPPQPASASRPRGPETAAR